MVGTQAGLRLLDIFCALIKDFCLNLGQLIPMAHFLCRILNASRRKAFESNVSHIK